VKVAFDLIWKQIRHSVILVDEPELHLHPTLAFRLTETLKLLGEGTNQLILFTHSSDLISTYYATGNVYFIDLDEPLVDRTREKYCGQAILRDTSVYAHRTGLA
jgi:predicted ATPase